MAQAHKATYVLIARALNNAMRDYRNSGKRIPAEYTYKIVTSIADELARDNRNFNRTVFYNAVLKEGSDR